MRFSAERLRSGDARAPNLQICGLTLLLGRYDAVGRVTQVLRPNGTKQTRTYDAAGQLTALRELAPNGTTVLYSGDYGYDSAGQLTKEALIPLTLPGLSTATQTFDRDNRLLTHNGGTTTFDADGNLLALGAGFMPGAYTYDARNRLLSAGGISYAYDAENRRIAQTDTSGTTHYAINPNAPLDQVLVRTAPGGTKTYYVYGLGLLHEETGSTVRYYHCDRRGDTVLLTDASGGVTDRASYGVFGDLVSRSGTTDTPFLFNGCYGVQTDANGLYYLRARYYHPALRRFLNQDSVLGSIASAMSLNRYAYANGNPVSAVDPFGTMAQDMDSNGRLTISEILSAIWSGAKEGFYNATIGSAVNAGNEAGQMYIDAREGGSGVLAALGLAVSQGLGRETGGLGLLEFYSGEQIGIGADGSLEASEFDSVSAWALHGGASYAQAFTTATGVTALGEKLMASETNATRAFWVGQDGELAAQASGAQVLQPSQAAVDAAKAGDWTLMRSESAQWAKGATGDVPVFFGDGKGRIFLNDELPEMLKNMDAGKVKSIDITF